MYEINSYILPITVYALSFKDMPVDHIAHLRQKVRDVYNILCSNGIHCVVLSTCLRFEVYIHTDKTDIIDGYLEKIFGNYWNYVRKQIGINAIKYLFEVSSGIHSQIVGEWEVLEQVERALKGSYEFSCCSQFLDEVFRKAVDVGRKVRLKCIGLDIKDLQYRGYPQIAIRVLSKILGDLSDKRLVFVGSGHAVRRAIRYLLNAYRSAAVIVVSDTDYRRACAVQEVCGENCIAVPIEDLEYWLSKADGVIVAVSSNKDSRLNKVKKVLEEIRLPVIDISTPQLVEKVHENIYTFQDIQKYAEELNVSVDTECVSRTINEEVEALLLHIAKHVFSSRISSFMKIAEVLSLYSADRLAKELNVDDDRKDIIAVAFRNHTHKILIPLIDFLLKRSIGRELDKEYFNSLLEYLENMYRTYIGVMRGEE